MSGGVVLSLAWWRGGWKSSRGNVFAAEPTFSDQTGTKGFCSGMLSSPQQKCKRPLQGCIETVTEQLWMIMRQSSFFECMKVKNAFLACQEDGFASLPLKSHSCSLLGQKYRKSKHALQMYTLMLLRGLADEEGTWTDHLRQMILAGSTQLRQRWINFQKLS